MDSRSHLKKPILSVIMPLYNVATTFRRAIDSVLMQKVDFAYEIILIDDASTDNTLDIAKEYESKYNFIKIIINPENSGNALSFYNGLCVAQGDFFCVLDGDDYYTINDKLQRQINFFRKDIDEEYVAVAHYFVIDLCNGELHIPDQRELDTFNYSDFITNNFGYYHTTTFMYRNIFRGRVPLYFSEKIYRGDTPRTTFHLAFSNKKVKILNFVGSAYVYHFDGIWSKLKESEQCEYRINYLTHHKNVVSSNYEKMLLNRQIEYIRKKEMFSNDNLRAYPSKSFDFLLHRIFSYASGFAFKQKEYIFNGLYYSEFLDSLLCTLSFVYKTNNPESVQSTTKKGNIAIVIGALVLKGGGIFHEIIDLIEIHNKQNIYIFVTNMDERPEAAIELLLQYNNVNVIFEPFAEGKYKKLLEHFKEIAPEKAYFYASHNDAYGISLMQSGTCKNICLFSFDHGFILGLSNPSIDYLVAKRPTDYYLLKKYFKDKVIYIPAWNNKKEDLCHLSYVPFNNHNSLYTASAAAREYKINGGEPYSYYSIILDLLERTKGKHIHFGEIPEEKLQYIQKELHDRNLSPTAFENIPWAESVAKSLIEHNIDVFVEPFPVVSYKVTLEAYSVGVPTIIFNGYKRMSVCDFAIDSGLSWNTRKDFVQTLESLDENQLKILSEKTLEYYYANHDSTTISYYLKNLTEFSTPQKYNVTDDVLCEIKEHIRVFNANFGIIRMIPPPEKPIEQPIQKEELKPKLVTKPKRASKKITIFAKRIIRAVLPKKLLDALIRRRNKRRNSKK